LGENGSERKGLGGISEDFEALDWENESFRWEG